MQDLTPIKQETQEFLYNFQVVEIETQEQYTQAGDILKQVKNKIKKLEDKRKEYTKPLVESKKAIDKDFKSITEPLENFIKSTKEEMVVFQFEEQKRLDEEQKKLEEEVLKKAEENGDKEVQVEIVNDIKTQRGDVSTTTARDVWKFEIEDVNKIPREYLTVDEKLIRQAIKDGKREIDGVYIYKDKQIIIR